MLMLIAFKLPRDLLALTAIDLSLARAELLLRLARLVCLLLCLGWLSCAGACRERRSAAASSVGKSVCPLLKYLECVKYMNL